MLRAALISFILLFAVSIDACSWDRMAGGHTHATAIAANSGSQSLAAGIANGGVWLNTGGGNDWEGINDCFLYTGYLEYPYFRTLDIQFVGSMGDSIILSCAQDMVMPYTAGSTVYLSTDGGTSWSKINGSFTLPGQSTSLAFTIQDRFNPDSL